MTTPSPYEPPRAPLDAAKPKTQAVPPTVGYLVGGIAQLALGGSLILGSALAAPPSPSLFGLLLTFLGLRTIIKYRVRTGNNNKDKP